MNKTTLLLALAMSAALLTWGQKEKTYVPNDWICLESTIPSYTMPEHTLDFLTVTEGTGCRIAVPISSGETLAINSDSLEARDAIESVFGSVESLKVFEQNRANDGEPFKEFPHTDFYTTLIQQFNYGKDSARGRFCTLYPRAYVPYLDWHGLTEPKPCSDKAPVL
jgi:hypothetical protein